MNFLMPIRPLGIGNIEVEALDSFFARIAFAHGITLLQMSRLLNDWAKKNTAITGDIDEFSDVGSSRCSLAGFTDWTDSIIKILSKATGDENIVRTTFMALKGAAASTAIQTVKSHRAWCNECLAEAIVEKSQFYDRLIWRASPIVRCLTHHTALITNCRKCGELQRHAHKSGQMSLCWKCSESLVFANKTASTVIDEVWGEAECISVVKAISNGELTKSKQSAFDTFIIEFRSIIKKKGLSGPFSEVVRLQSLGAEQKPSLTRMIQISKASGVSILSILENPEQSAINAVNNIKSRRWWLKGGDFETIESAQNAVLLRIDQEMNKGESISILTTSQLSDEIGVSKKFLKKCCNEKIRELQRRWRSSNSKVRFTNLHKLKSHLKVMPSHELLPSSEAEMNSLIEKLSKEFFLPNAMVSQEIVKATRPRYIRVKKLPELSSYRKDLDGNFIDPDALRERVNKRLAHELLQPAHAYMPTTTEIARELGVSQTILKMCAPVEVRELSERRKTSKGRIRGEYTRKSTES